MNTHRVSSSRTSGFQFELNQRNLAFGGEALAVACQVFVSLLSLNDELKVFLFIVFTLFGMAVLMWWSSHSAKHGEPKSTSNILVGLLVFGALVALAIIAKPSVLQAYHVEEETRLAKPTVSSPIGGLPTTYYVRIHVYADEGYAGVEDETDKGLSNIPVTVRDEFGTNAMYRTNKGGDALVRLPRSGQFSIGVCHEFQTHEVHDNNNAKEKASLVNVGIAPSQVDACRT